MTQRTPPYSPAVPSRAVRMVPEYQGEHASRWGAIASIAAQIGCSGRRCGPGSNRPSVTRDSGAVHSYSRFFPDTFGLELYHRRLAKLEARIVSITQEVGDDAAQEMIRQVLAMFDEYRSRESGQYVLRAMKENARQGFYNGAPRPLGYTLSEIEKRCTRIMKRLVIDPAEAETVRLRLRLYRTGDGTSGPLRVKVLTCQLDERGHRTRAGARFGVAPAPRSRGGLTRRSCSTRVRQGEAGCTGRSIRMDSLDALATNPIVAELLQPDRLRATLASL